MAMNIIFNTRALYRIIYCNLMIIINNCNKLYIKFITVLLNLHNNYVIIIFNLNTKITINVLLVIYLLSIFYS